MADQAGAGPLPGHKAFPRIFSQGRIGGLTLRNRSMVAPLTRTSATVDGRVTQEMIDYYAEFARGGWGLVIAEATYIDIAYSQGYNNQPGIAYGVQQESWKPVVEAAHKAGTPIFLQIFHAGAVNQGNHWKIGSIAPSNVQPLGNQIDRYGGSGPFQTPREITREEMKEVVASFAAAAKRAVDIGFDGVEVHGANGYLPDQFLTVYTNKRTDEYGGPVHNRIRFHVEIMQAVRDAVKGKPVGVRISQTKVNDLTYSWPGGVKDAEVVFPALAKTGIDFIHVSAHLGAVPVFNQPLSLAGLAKKLTGLTIIGNGKLHEPKLADELIGKGEADFFTVGKGALADPAWASKIAAGQTPIPFDPGMTSPLATIANTTAWRKRQGLKAAE
jgi:2,4-dienoyl-CoA reductase-like NADH-dependent reductase (Old Yellow Enzyme family)